MHFSASIDYVDIARRSSANNGGVGKASYFVAKCVNISKTVRDSSKFTIYEIMTNRAVVGL